jgi:hypothetical protein
MISEHLKEIERPERYLEPKMASEISAAAKDLIVAASRKGYLHVWHPEAHDSDSPTIKHFGVFFNRQDAFDESFNEPTTVRALAETSYGGAEIVRVNIQTDFGKDQNLKYIFDISEGDVDIGAYHWEDFQNKYYEIEDGQQRQELLENLQLELDGLVSSADNETGNFS